MLIIDEVITYMTKIFQTDHTYNRHYNIILISELLQLL